MTTKRPGRKAFPCCFLAMTLVLGRFLRSLDPRAPEGKHMIFCFVHPLGSAEKVLVPHQWVVTHLFAHIGVMIWSVEEAGEALSFRQL